MNFPNLNNLIDLIYEMIISNKKMSGDISACNFVILLWHVRFCDSENGYSSDIGVKQLHVKITFHTLLVNKESSS